LPEPVDHSFHPNLRSTNALKSGLICGAILGQILFMLRADAGFPAPFQPSASRTSGGFWLRADWGVRL